MTEPRYLHLSDEPISKTIEMWPGIFVDLDKQGRPVGIENLNGDPEPEGEEKLDLGDGPRF